VQQEFSEHHSCSKIRRSRSGTGPDPSIPGNDDDDLISAKKKKKLSEKAAKRRRRSYEDEDEEDDQRANCWLIHSSVWSFILCPSLKGRNFIPCS
jgi:hypothetical protein